MKNVYVGLRRLATKGTEGIEAGDIVEVVKFDASKNCPEWQSRGYVDLKNLRTGKVSHHGGCVLGENVLDTVPVPEVPADPEPQQDWSVYVPRRVLPRTGSKFFQVGEVWACALPNYGVFGDRFVFRVESLREQNTEYAKIRILAGSYTFDEIARTSVAAYHCARISSKCETLLPEEFDREVFPAEVKKVEIEEPKRPQWLATVEKIMTKAEEHYKAGRGGNFQQVLVPKEEYNALQEHFHVEGTNSDVVIATCLGLIAVYPVNPDGATLVD